MQHWTDSALGNYLLQWEQQRCDEAVADIFGYHSLQLGMPMLQALRSNRMPDRWLALDSSALQDWQAVRRLGNVPSSELPIPSVLVTAPEALPFAEKSLDLVVLPHTLETCEDPHAVLREAARVLMPEGRLVVCGLNPMSLMGVQRRLERRTPYLPGIGWGVGYWRLRDWLSLLALDIEAVQFGCYRPATQSEQWLKRWEFLDRWGHKGWPVLGGVYCVVAVKRVVGMRLIEPSWRSGAAPKGSPVMASKEAAAQPVSSQQGYL